MRVVFRQVEEELEPNFLVVYHEVHNVLGLLATDYGIVLYEQDCYYVQDGQVKSLPLACEERLTAAHRIIGDF